MTPERLAEIRSRVNQGGGYLSGTSMDMETTIAAYRDVPDLLAEVERLRPFENALTQQTVSRAHWKDRAEAAEKRVAELEAAMHEFLKYAQARLNASGHS